MEFNRYSKTEKVVFNNVITYGKWSSFDFLVKDLPNSSVKSYLVNSDKEGRPDLISNELYGNSQLSWVLIAFNKVLDPFNWPKTGDIIRYPIESVVVSEII